MDALRDPRAQPMRGLKSVCERAGACNPDSSDAEVRTYFQTAATRARSRASEAERDRLDCALGRLGWVALQPKPCDRAEAQLAPRIAEALTQTEGAQRLAMAAEACAEVAGCGRDCAQFLSAYAGVDPEWRHRLPRCLEAAAQSREALDGWVLARVRAWMRAAAPLVNEEGRRRILAADQRLGP
jgi:hypothetical protein